MTVRIPDAHEVALPHDSFDAPDAEGEKADARERVLEGGESAGDGDTERVRRERGLDEGGR